MGEQLKIGDKVPNFKLQASNGTDVELADYSGKKLVIYFYPRDMTPGCTTESCDFRDFNGQFGENNAEVIGISPDDLASHEQLRYPSCLAYGSCEAGMAWSLWGSSALLSCLMSRARSLRNGAAYRLTVTSRKCLRR